MKQFKLLDGFFYRKRYIPALDYTIEDFGNGERYLTGMNGNVPVSIKLTPGLEKVLFQEVHSKRIDAFDSIMSAIYGAGPLPVGLDKEKFRIKRLIQEAQLNRQKEE